VHNPLVENGARGVVGERLGHLVHEIQDDAVLLREDLALFVNPVSLAARAHQEHEHGENTEDETKAEKKKPHVCVNDATSQASCGAARNDGNAGNFYARNVLSKAAPRL
jgi:hypothetical protein